MCYEVNEACVAKILQLAIIVLNLILLRLFGIFVTYILLSIART